MLVFVLGLSGQRAGDLHRCAGPTGQARSAGQPYIGKPGLADLFLRWSTLPLGRYTGLRFPWPSARRCAALQLRCVLLTCGSWLRGAWLALPALLLRDTQPGPADNLTVCDMDFSGVASAQSERYWRGALSLGTTALGFLLPLLLMTLFYCCIGASLSRHFQHLRKEQEKRRLLRIIATLVAVFALCWLPFHLLKSLYVLSELGLLELPCAFLALVVLLHPYATCLAYINSCLNPFLYAFFDLRFRAQCRLLLGLRPALRGPAGSGSSTLSAQTQKSELYSLATKV
nr:apelin receptor-like [Chelonoidis abingdonii]